MVMPNVRLVVPQVAFMHGYRDALVAGWSPSTMVDNSASMLARLDDNPKAHLEDLACLEMHPAGEPALFYRQWWVWDGAFCGLIVLVHRAGTADLPERMPGHVGYNIVPDKQGRGYASEAVRMMLPLAAEHGLPYVRITCRPENVASCRVAEKAGAVLREERVFPLFAKEPRRLYQLGA